MTPSDREASGQRIARARRRRGLSQAVLAGLVGRSESWLSQVERGKRGVDSHSVLVRLAEVLRVDVAELTRSADRDETARRAYPAASLMVEGVGAARRESAHLIDAAIWVQSDGVETEHRNLARVGQPEGLPTEQDHREWMAEEVPFQARQRSWERADLITCGTPQIPFDPATELVVAPPLACRTCLRHRAASWRQPS